MVQYRILLHDDAYRKATSYLKACKEGSQLPGAYLRTTIEKSDISRLTLNGFIERLVNSKRPQIFAESAVSGDGQDWNQAELSILGDIGIAVPVTVYDDGLHHNPRIHTDPFKAMLLYVPGALLRNDRGKLPADWEEVTIDGELDPTAYYALYERRLLPSFLYANEFARSKNKRALITIPGIGCGQFAGKFRGRLGTEFKNVLLEFLNRFSGRLPNIRAVYYDPYQECANERLEIGQISFLVRPLLRGNEHKPQLCPPEIYQENGDDFNECQLFSFVAWDHVSWPGNDFYAGSRATDDGVKAAATDSMAVMTGIEGDYNVRNNTYDPPAEYDTWGQVVRKNNLRLQVQENLLTYA